MTVVLWVFPLCTKILDRESFAVVFEFQENKLLLHTLSTQGVR